MHVQKIFFGIAPNFTARKRSSKAALWIMNSVVSNISSRAEGTGPSLRSRNSMSPSAVLSDTKRISASKGESASPLGVWE